METPEGIQQRVYPSAWDQVTAIKLGLTLVSTLCERKFSTLEVEMEAKLKGKAIALLSVTKISQIWPQRLFCRKYRIAVRSPAPEEKGWGKSRENKTQTTA